MSNFDESTSAPHAGATAGPPRVPAGPDLAWLALRLVESSPDGIFAFDREFRFLVWNRAMERVTGVSAAAAVGRAAFELFPFLLEIGEDEYFRRALAGEAVTSYDRPYAVAATGRAGLFEARYSPLTDGSGAVVGGLAVIRDVTERKRAETDRARLVLEQTARAVAERERERYRAFVEQSSEGIWRSELDVPVDVSLPAEEQVRLFFRHAHLAECNDAMARMYGFERAEEIVGARLGDLLLPDDPANVAYLVRLVERGYRLENAESHEVDRAGREKYFENTMVGVVEDGRLVRVWGTQRDITDRKNAEAALAESERRFRLLADATPVLIWQSGPNKGRVYFNRVWLEFTGRSYPEEAGDGWAAGVHPEDLDLCLGAFAAAFDRREPFEAEYRLRRADGAYRWVFDRGVPLVAPDGSFRGYIGACVDVTERLLAERERERLLASEQRLRREAEEASRLKDEFLATVSHELRTPMNSILGWATILRSRTLDADVAARAVETIERNARAQVHLIEDLLDISRIVTGRMRLKVEPLDLAAVVEAAVDAVRPAAEAKSIRIQAVLESCPGGVIGDAERLQQVVWNLLSNAVKFTQRAGRVQVSLARLDSQAVVTVADTGQGIAPEFLPHVFDRFRQEDSSISREHGGLGLGLAIVRHLVELHGGSVSAASDGVGRGSTFVVRLPLAVARRDAAEPARAAATAANDAGAAPLAGVRVLAVDDERDTLELLGFVLGESGAAVRTAGSTAEAVEALDAWPPDVLVSDVGMPGEDGYALIGRVRGRAGAYLPALALTAYARAEDRVALLSAGFDAHLPKPVDPAELVATVASLARRFRS